MLHLNLAALLIAAIMMLIAYGCGGSSKIQSIKTTASTAATSTMPLTTATPTTPSTTITAVKLASGKSLTRAQLIAKGDAICAHANLQLKSIKVKTSRELAQDLPQAAGYDHAEFVKLHRLVPPPSMANDWQQILTGVQAFAEDTTKTIPYAQANNVEATQPLIAAGRTVRQQLFAIAKRNGFTDCSHV